jgi:hypothetical protein
MTKVKGATILGALVFVGATLLLSFPALSAKSFLLVSAKRLVKACEHHVADDEAQQQLEQQGCKIIAGVVDKLGPYLVDEAPELPPEVLDKVARKFRSPVRRFLRTNACCDPACDPEFEECPTTCQTPCRSDRCLGCTQAVSDLEAWLATNGTVADIADTLDEACIGRPSESECIDQVYDYIPRAVDNILANLPPTEVCERINYCQPQ